MSAWTPEKIRELRSSIMGAKGLTQREFARLVGVSERTISRLETSATPLRDSVSKRFVALEAGWKAADEDKRFQAKALFHNAEPERAFSLLTS